MFESGGPLEPRPLTRGALLHAGGEASWVEGSWIEIPFRCHSRNIQQQRQCLHSEPEGLAGWAGGNDQSTRGA